jgi:hypothetical protein
VARRKREALTVPYGLSRWWIEKLMERGLTLEQAIEAEQDRRDRMRQRLRDWRPS